MQGRYGDDILAVFSLPLRNGHILDPVHRRASRSDREDIMPRNHRSFFILTLIAPALLAACSTDPTRTVAPPSSVSPRRPAPR